jgi:hypothetical protein
VPKKNVTTELARTLIPTEVLNTLTEQQIQAIIDLMYIHAEFIVNHIIQKQEMQNSKGNKHNE